MRDIAFLLEKASACVDSAKLLAERGDHGGAINRAFYAMHNAATAALSKEGAEPKTHSGLISEFSQRFVQTGRIPGDLGRAFNEAENARMVADYTDRAVTPDLSQRIVASAARFVAEVRRIVEPAT